MPSSCRKLRPAWASELTIGQGRTGIQFTCSWALDFNPQRLLLQMLSPVSRLALCPCPGGREAQGRTTWFPPEENE